MARLKSLQGVRAVAALLVVFFHTQSIFLIHCNFVPFGGRFAQGDKGVDLFFVLSGFIMILIHNGDLGQPAKTLAYVISRVTRIFPLLWIMSLLALVTYASGFEAAKEFKLNPGYLIDSFLLLPQQGTPLVNVSWTLVYEMFFYVLFGSLILNRAIGTVALTAWQLIVLACLLTNVDTSPVWAFYLRPIALEFSIGMAAGLLIIALPVTNIRWKLLGPCCLAIGVAAFLIFLSRPPAAPRFLTFGVAAGFIIFGCAAAERAGLIKTPSPIVFLGDASYAIYMVHFSVVTLIVTLLSHRHHLPLSSLVAAAVAIAAISAGGVFYVAVDRPISRALGHLFKRWKSSRVPGAVPAAS